MTPWPESHSCSHWSAVHQLRPPTFAVQGAMAPAPTVQRNRYLEPAGHTQGAAAAAALPSAHPRVAPATPRKARTTTWNAEALATTMATATATAAIHAVGLLSAHQTVAIATASRARTTTWNAQRLPVQATPMPVESDAGWSLPIGFQLSWWAPPANAAAHVTTRLAASSTISTMPGAPVARLVIASCSPAAFGKRASASRSTSRMQTELGDVGAAGLHNASCRFLRRVAFPRTHQACIG